MILAHTTRTKDQLEPTIRNADPKLHPFEAPREYQRALNAVKLERTFAKPFIASLEGCCDLWCCSGSNQLILLTRRPL